MMDFELTDFRFLAVVVSYRLVCEGRSVTTKTVGSEWSRDGAKVVAVTNSESWFHKASATTDEFDFTDALDWFGLQFTTPDLKQPDLKWKLVPRDGASDPQKNRLATWLGKTSR